MTSRIQKRGTLLAAVPRFGIPDWVGGGKIMASKGILSNKKRTDRLAIKENLTALRYCDDNFCKPRTALKGLEQKPHLTVGLPSPG